MLSISFWYVIKQQYNLYIVLTSNTVSILIIIEKLHLYYDTYITKSSHLKTRNGVCTETKVESNLNKYNTIWLSETKQYFLCLI